MMNSRGVLRVLSAALLAGAGFAEISSSAMAADFGGMNGTLFERRSAEHTVAVSGGFTSDYVFRGISQSDNDPAVFAGMELSYRMFYVGIWGSSVSNFTSSSWMEFDVYGGIKKTFNGVDFDLGVLYYAYPGNNAVLELNYVELKAAASMKVWRDIALTGTVFYSPDYYSEAGETWTVEGKLSVPLQWWGLTLSGAYGYVTSADDAGIFSGAYGGDSYNYWNVGLSKTFRERFTIDVRYWGTNVDVDSAVVASAGYLNGIADERIVATLTFNY